MSSEIQAREPCDRIEPLLEDLVDGHLTKSQQRRIRRHLEDCEDCTARLESLEKLLAEVDALPRDLKPATDLWPDIASRLTARPEPAPARWTAWSRQAAAALLFMAFGGLLSQLLWPGRSKSEAPAREAAFAESRANDQAGFALVEIDVLRAKEALWVAVYTGHAAASPETRGVVERNLRVIDQAIRELRQALAADPGNPQLESLLLARHRTEIDLLQRLRRTTLET